LLVRARRAHEQRAHEDQTSTARPRLDSHHGPEANVVGRTKAKHLCDLDPQLVAKTVWERIRIATETFGPRVGRADPNRASGQSDGLRDYLRVRGITVSDSTSRPSRLPTPAARSRPPRYGCSAATCGR